MIFQVEPMHLFCAAILSIGFALSAGAQEKTTVIFNAARDNDSAMQAAIYQYPEFTGGKAVFTNRAEIAGKFNYNYLTSNIAFISESGDTLAIANPEQVSKVVIQKDTFYFFEGFFLRQLTHFPTYNLFVRPSTTYAGSEKKGAYGTYSATTSSENISTVTDGRSTVRPIAADENIVYRFTVAYFVSDRLTKFFPATKRGIYDVFGGHEKQIKAFVKEQAINFAKQADLEKLLYFVQSLGDN